MQETKNVVNRSALVLLCDKNGVVVVEKAATGSKVAADIAEKLRRKIIILKV